MSFNGDVNKMLAQIRDYVEKRKIMKTDKKMQNYEVIVHSDPAMFNNMINQYLGYGFEPFGFPLVRQDGAGADTLYAQVMVKYEDEGT